MTPPPIERGGTYGVKRIKSMYFFKNLLLYLGACFRQYKCKVMMTKEGSTQIVNVLTSGAGVFAIWCGHISHLVKMHYSF